jgi:putative peptide zinc metalloprotease protein
MPQLRDVAAGRADVAAPASAGAATSARDDVPVRADGVQLIGEMTGSGYREPPALARRADGQTLQLSALLYLVLAAVDGERDCEAVAASVSRSYGRAVSGDNVRQLVDSKLRPLGLLKRPDGTDPKLKRSNPLLALRFKYAVSDPGMTRRLTAPFARLFHPLIVLAVLAGFAAITWWVLLDKGLASATYQAFDRPELLLLVFAVTVLSAGFHEFGHAAAARYGGATPGVMGAGIYLVWPAFYTDVTDSYRLGRGGRLRTDLGGLYFNAIVAVAIAGVCWATGYDALLLVVATQILQMVRQLMPLVRFDGYHVRADLTGVPDLFQRITPTLLALLPWHWGDPAAKVLKPWARTVVTVWVLVVVPILLFSLTMMVLALPRVLATAWAQLQEQQTALASAWGDGHLAEVAARSLAILALAFPILASFVVLARVLRRTAASIWRKTAGRPVRRAAALGVAGTLVAGLAWAWWPEPGTYRPIQPYERGTVIDGMSALPLARPMASGLREGSTGTMRTLWPADEKLPSADAPQLAMVLVPRQGTTAEDDTAPASAEPGPASRAGGASGTTGWVFPFDKPLEPGAGDNQALAVNTTDNTVTYDTVFALVWADGSQPAANTNEAYALASCNNCAAVAVAFQVVMVVGDNHAAAPQNVSAAVNYNCVNCLTYALAIQLFVTLDHPLSEASTAQLEQLWAQIADFGAHIREVPLTDIQKRLADYERQILAIVAADQPTSPSASPSPSPSASLNAASSVAPSAPLSPDAPPVSTTAGSATASPTATSTDEASPTAASGTAANSPAPSSPATTSGTGATSGAGASTSPSPTPRSAETTPPPS